MHLVQLSPQEVNQYFFGGSEIFGDGSHREHRISAGGVASEMKGNGSSYAMKSTIDSYTAAMDSGFDCLPGDDKSPLQHAVVRHTSEPKSSREHSVRVVEQVIGKTAGERRRTLREGTVAPDHSSREAFVQQPFTKTGLGGGL